MKQKILAGVLSLAVLLSCVTLGRAVSQPETLISLGYLNGTYSTGLQTTVSQLVAAAAKPIYDAAAAKAGQSAGQEEGWQASSTFTAGQGVYGDTVGLRVGSGLLWLSGSAAVSSGVLVDATTGTEVPAGGALTAGHRYLAGEDAVVVVSAQSAQWMAEGVWTRGTGGTVVVPLPFTDVSQDQWYYDDVRYVVEKELFEGVGEGRFAPGSTMQRRMMTTVLHRLAGRPTVEYSPVFTDIPDGQWYTQGTIWAAQLGVVKGMGDGRFAPTSDVTRQQIAVMLYNYAVEMGHAADERGDLSGFSDAASVASWARDAMSWAVGVDILRGSGGALLPGNNATRAQVAAMLHRFQGWLDAQAQ